MFTFDFGVIEQIRRQVGLFPLAETGGLLAGKGRSVTHALAAVNEAGADVRRAFTIGPEQMVDLLSPIEERGLSLLGSYHSHPRAPATMSAADAMTAKLTGALLIIAPRASWEWKLWDPVAGGEVGFAIRAPRS